MAVIECVPNFSEGRDRAIIEALATAAASIDGARLLDRTSDPDHNRTVLTIAGEPDAVSEAALCAVRVAVERMRLPEHTGVHPRIGVADVVPFVPVSDATIESCARLATKVAERVWTELQVPVFLYEAAARDASRSRLESIRSRSFAGEPDFGTGRHPTAGAAVIGARPFLIAWNINLHSEDLHAAREIAKRVRESSGGLQGVKALGLALRSRRQVQVSINLTNFAITPLHEVFDLVSEQAAKRSIRIAGSELIGLVPQRALEASSGHDLHWLAGPGIADYVLERRLEAATIK